MSFDYPPAEVELEILQNEAGIEENIGKKLIQLGNKIRNLVELGLTETSSTRLLVDAGKLIKDGLPPRLSCEVAIVQPLTDDKITIQALKDLVSLVF